MTKKERIQTKILDLAKEFQSDEPEHLKLEQEDLFRISFVFIGVIMDIAYTKMNGMPLDLKIKKVTHIGKKLRNFIQESTGIDVREISE